jgi:hypothetical protein
MKSASTDKPRGRPARYKRPQFFDSPETDMLLSMIIDLAGEVSVLRDRLDTHERLSVASGGFGPTDVDGYRADAADAAQRDEARSGYLRRVLRRPLQQAMENSESGNATGQEALVELLTEGVAP